MERPGTARAAACIGLAAGTLWLLPGPVARAAESVPVQVGGEPDYDACGGTATVAGLAPGSALNVRAGPGLDFPVVDRLGPGAAVILCDQRGDWQGIVFTHAPADCGTGQPVMPRGPYAGPCRSGWVHGRHVRLSAG